MNSLTYTTSPYYRPDIDGLRAIREYFSKWAKIYPNQVYVIDSGEALCDNKECYMLSKDGEPLFTDRNHLTDLGASLVSERAWKEIGPILKGAIQ